MAKVLSLFSPTGGIGKSTLALHLAQVLAKNGKRVLLIDASPLSPSLDILADVAEQVVYTLSDIANGFCDPARASLSLDADGKLSLLPLAAGEDLSEGSLARAVKEAVKALSSDFVIIDASPTLYDDARAVSDTVLLLTDLCPASLRSAEAFVSAHEGIDRFLLTRASFSYEGCQRETPVIDTVDRVSLPLLGVLPYTPRLRTVGEIPQHSPYERALYNIAKRLLGENVPLLSGVTLEGMSRRYFIERQAKDEG